MVSPQTGPEPQQDIWTNDNPLSCPPSQHHHHHCTGLAPLSVSPGSVGLPGSDRILSLLRPLTSQQGEKYQIQKPASAEPDQNGEGRNMYGSVVNYFCMLHHWTSLDCR